jgi:hypothetical protein
MWVCGLGAPCMAIRDSLPGRQMAGAPMSTAHENVARRAVMRHLEKRQFLATISR